MALLFEKWYPITTAALAGAFYLLFLRDRGVPETLHEVFGAAVNVSAIAVGFLATAKSILISLDDKRVITHLKQTGKYSVFVNYLLRATQYSFALALLSGCALAVRLSSSRPWQVYVFAAWLFFLVASLLSYYRVIHVFAKILRTL